MTVSSKITRVDYSGNDSTTAFATTFRFLADSELKVIIRVDATEVETVQAITTDYTVTGSGLDAGGTVTMLTAPATGETLVIKRDMLFTQLIDYTENDPFPAETHEQGLDRMKMEIQQVTERADRSLHFKETSSLSDIELPDIVAGKFIRGNTAGTAYENVSVVAGASVLSASEIVEGIVERATLAEVGTGTDSSRYVSPEGVKQETDLLLPLAGGTMTGDIVGVNDKFSAFINATASSGTGDGTVWELTGDNAGAKVGVAWSEVTDVGGIFDTTAIGSASTGGVMTANIAGNYQFNISIQVLSLETATTSIFLKLVTSNRTYRAVFNDSTIVSGGSLNMSASFLADMDVADTARLSLTVSGGTKVVGALGDGTELRSTFSGYLIV